MPPASSALITTTSEGAPPTNNYGAEAVSYLHSLHNLHDLCVTVVSDDGWSWVLAWAQVGVRRVCVCPLTERSRRNLEEVRTTLDGFAELVEVGCSPITDLSGRRALVCAHVGRQLGELLAQALCEWTFETFALLSCCQGSVEALKRCLPAGTRQKDLRHRQLGGLTTARLTVLWAGPSFANPNLATPGSKPHPVRPLSYFLEPSVKLVEWEQVGTMERCWRPQREEPEPYPWPLDVAPRWVEARTVYLADRDFVERPLTDKERAQLMDVRED